LSTRHHSYGTRRRAAKRPQTPLLLALALVAGAVLFVLLPRTGRSRVLAPAEGGTFVEAVAGPATRVNPLDDRATPAERDLAALIFAGLTRPGADGRPRPALADSWHMSDDARVFTFRLRSGVTWHDGHPVTADDVLFSVGALKAMGERADPLLAGLWSDASVSQVGNDLVRVELARPFAPLPSFASFGLLPAHLLADVPGERLADHDYFRSPVGAGPFRLRSLAGDRAVLTRFERYALGPPLLDSIELRFEADTRSARDAAARGAFDAVLAAEGDTAPAGMSPHHAVRSAYTVVLLNHRTPLFSDANVRRALSLALDRNSLAARFGGVALDTPFTPGWWSDPGLTPLVGDREAAERLLTDAGWKREASGVRRREGRELAFTIVVPSEQMRVSLARAVADAWQALGARVTVAPGEPATLLRDFLVPREYEAALIGWDPGPDPDPFNGWSASLRGSSEGNLGDADDADLDSLASQARAAASLDERAALYRQFAERFRQVTPGVVLLAEELTYATRHSVGGIALAAVAEPAQRFADVQRWYVRTRRR
jgi:peptide/nickel transport system substrate-binding protein